MSTRSGVRLSLFKSWLWYFSAVWPQIRLLKLSVPDSLTITAELYFSPWWLSSETMRNNLEHDTDSQLLGNIIVQ